MIKTSLKAIASNKDPYEGAVQLLRDDLGFPLREISQTQVDLGRVLQQDMKEVWNRVVNRSWFLGVVGDDVLGDVGPDPDHEGIAFFLLDCPKGLWDAEFGKTVRDITRSLNRSFSSHHVIVLFCHPDGRGASISFGACERVPYKVAHLEGEKASRVATLKSIPLRQPLKEHMLVLGAMNARGMFLRNARSFQAIIARWMKIFDAGDIGVLKATFKQKVLEEGDLPDMAGFREHYGRFAFNSIQLRYTSYREFLQAALGDSHVFDIDRFVVDRMLQAYTCFYRAFLYPPLQVSLCHMTQEENMKLVSRKEIPELLDAYNESFREVQLRYGKKYPRATTEIFPEAETWLADKETAKELLAQIKHIRKHWGVR